MQSIRQQQHFLVSERDKARAMEGGFKEAAKGQQQPELECPCQGQGGLAGTPCPQDSEIVRQENRNEQVKRE